jgi:hypothetical protein
MEGMDMSKVEDMNILEGHDLLSNHRSEEEGIDMTEEYPSKERPEVEHMDTEDEGMYMVEEHPSKERS